MSFCTAENSNLPPWVKQAIEDYIAEQRKWMDAYTAVFTRYQELRQERRRKTERVKRFGELLREGNQARVSNI